MCRVMPKASSSPMRGDSYQHSKTYHCRLSPQTSWLPPPQVTMGAAKLCQNLHLIGTFEWKLQIRVISTLSATASPPTHPFLQHFITLQIHRLDRPSPFNICALQLYTEPALALRGAIDTNPWFALVWLLTNPEKETVAFP